jgi:hypothetical protein
MHGFLAEHSGAFDPAEIRILVAAFDKAWEAVQESGTDLRRGGRICAGGTR